MPARRQPVLAGVVALLLLLHATPVARGQLSAPIASDDAVDAAGNKFLRREATADERVRTAEG